MDLGRFIPAPQAARDAGAFVAANLRYVSAVDFFAAERFTRLRELGGSESWTEVAAEYRNVTGDDVKTSVIAAEVLKAVLKSEDLGKDTNPQ